MSEVWILTLYFVGRDPYIFEDKFKTERACERAGIALVLATYDKVNYKYAIPPFSCKMEKSYD